MDFILHISGLHYYEPPKKDLVLFNTVSKKKEMFSKRKTKIAVEYWELQHTLRFINVKEGNWITRRNYIQECPSKKIWGKYISYLKGKTTRKKPIEMTEYLIRV